MLHVWCIVVERKRKSSMIRICPIYPLLRPAVKSPANYECGRGGRVDHGEVSALSPTWPYTRPACPVSVMEIPPGRGGSGCHGRHPPPLFSSLLIGSDIPTGWPFFHATFVLILYKPKTKADGSWGLLGESLRSWTKNPKPTASCVSYTLSLHSALG